MPDPERGLAAYPVPLPVNPFTNPDLREKSTLGFRPDPMAQTVRNLPARLMQNADESLTKNIMAYMPKPKESRYGSIRMPRASDDPMNAGAFVMAGPLAVEEVLGKFAAKALPAKVLETKLLQMGASKTELETRGVTKYLESQGTRPVHPLEVMKHLDDNPFQLNEVIRSDRTELRPSFQLAYSNGTRLGQSFNTEEEAVAAMKDLRNPKAALGRGQQEPLQIIETMVDKPPHPAKFQQWQTPGGENYREILLQAPDTNKRRLINGKPAQYDEAGNLYPEFTGGHWDEPNVVAHMRVNDRTLPSGERALHVEEWQSDWAIANRETAKRIEEGVPDRPTNFLTPHKPRLDPSHPLVDNWQDLMVRRTLKEAVDGGYDRLTWTTGQQQADRYDLSTQLSAIRYNPKTKLMEVKPKNDPEWQVLNGQPHSLEPEELSRYIGKGPAEKLLTTPIGSRKGNTEVRYLLSNDNRGIEYYVKRPGQPGKSGYTYKEHVTRDLGEDVADIILNHTGTPMKSGWHGAIIYKEPIHQISGLDLKVGGEWATKLYDESMVNRFNKIGKRYGVKVEDVPLTKKTYPIGDSTPNVEMLPGIRNIYGDENIAAADELKKGINKPVVVHSLKITPEMKESIGGSKFHPFADLPGPKPKVAPTPPPTPAAAKKVDLSAEAAALDPDNPVRYVGDQMGYPLLQQEPPGVGSFIVRPGESVADAYARAKARYQK